MDNMYYVYAYDKIWKDWMCCECSTYEEAKFVRDKWESFSDRNRVTIENGLRKRRASMYVIEDGWISKKEDWS